MDLTVSTDIIDSLFGSAVANTQANLDSLAGTILGQGIDYFQNEKYDQAVKCFKQAAALSPSSDNAFNAYDYLGQAYVKLEDTEAAVKTYQEAIRAFPTVADDTFYVALGDLYMKQEGMLEEAAATYEEAVAIDPNNGESRYSLGQTYLQVGDLDKARKQFNEVVRITPASAAGYYGLGQVAHLQGDQEEAVMQLTKAIQVNAGFELAYLELGYVYADRGEFSKAEEQSSILNSRGSDKVSTLDAYITLTQKPRMLGALSTNGFNVGFGPKTRVSSFSPSLANANGSKLFSMNIAFSKDMDETSIINPRNWTISRATLRNNGGVYNYGLTPSSKEATIAPTPAFVTFNKETNTATIYFRLSQNATIDATIDPNHIVFKFSGLDAYGKAMDTSADEYSGFSGVA